MDDIPKKLTFILMGDKCDGNFDPTKGIKEFFAVNISDGNLQRVGIIWHEKNKFGIKYKQRGDTWCKHDNTFSTEKEALNHISKIGYIVEDIRR